jgi:hypothetical protein
VKSQPIFLLLVSLTALSLAQNSRQCLGQDPMAFYVSPTGADNNPGTEAKPLLTFAKATETVARAIAGGLEGCEICVYFRGGRYPFDRGVVVRACEFSKGGNRIVFSAYPGEKPVFSGAVELTKWTLLQGTLPALPDAAKGKIWVADLPDTGQEGIARFLCDQSGPLQNSISKGLLTAEDASLTSFNDYNSDKCAPEERSSFVFPDSSLKQWSNLKDIEVAVIPYRSWVYEIMPLKSIDTANHIAHTEFPAMHKICKMWHYSKFGEPNLWVLNAVDYLDEPGEWAIDSSARKIYYWPEKGRPATVYYPVVKELICVEGDENKKERAKNITFKGITFAHGDRFTRKQASSGKYNTRKPDALLRFIDSEGCTVDQCVFTNSGGGGVRFDSYGKGNRVANCEFSRLGGTGVLIAGTKSNLDKYEGNNEIVNNEICDIGRIYKTSAGVAIEASNGNRVANNLIYNTPYNAIYASGGPIKNNVIEWNEVHHSCLDIHDGNAIYMNGLYSLIRRNYLHDNLSTKLHGVIRSDDWGKDMVITENIIYRFADCGIKFKQPTTVTNNFIIDWVPTEWVNGDKYPMAQFLQIAPSQPIKGSVIRNNIYYQSAGATQPFFALVFNRRYPELKEVNKVCDIDMDGNLYYAAGVYHDSVKQLAIYRKGGVDKNSMVADPLFEGLDGKGFRLNEKSPAFRLGIQQIDFEKIGRKTGRP